MLPYTHTIINKAQSCVVPILNIHHVTTPGYRTRRLKTNKSTFTVLPPHNCESKSAYKARRLWQNPSWGTPKSNKTVNFPPRTRRWWQGEGIKKYYFPKSKRTEHNDLEYLHMSINKIIFNTSICKNRLFVYHKKNYYWVVLSEIIHFLTLTSLSYIIQET